MENPGGLSSDKEDSGASDRKKDHIKLAFESRIDSRDIDDRFYYEPIFAAHPSNTDNLTIQFLGKNFKAPIWVSSMTGGTSMAKTININLAKVCGEFGLGMGLGSCRQLLYSDEYLEDFNVRKYIGEQPLFINLGIAQLEYLIKHNETHRIAEIIKKLECDGLIIHVNPMQEWLQPEGDKFDVAPIVTIQRIIEKVKCAIIVKEVGQGMGIRSIEALLKLPIQALDFGANGGTNFALLEILRSSEIATKNYSKLAFVGHSAGEMVEMVNQLIDSSNASFLCKQIIVSGGVNDFLDGYYYTQKLNIPSIYGHASGFLKYAMDSYESLQEYVDLQIKGLSLAKAYLKVK
ncbi:MAG: type 2 isopentenyl-diphosphate Delta-isomerase [Saprospiraceae bacterium]|nr:type 2 isopentenyl-diphosphate Delta-isomerase [Saprospiraceae bacterium]